MGFLSDALDAGLKMADAGMEDCVVCSTSTGDRDEVTGIPACNKCKEELGHYPTVEKIVPIEHFTSADEKFIYHTFFGVCEKEFIPTL